MILYMPSALVRTIAANVRQHREDAGLTQYQLADKAGVHRNTLAKLETGKSDSIRCSTLEQLATALGLEVDQLLEPRDCESVVKQSLAQFLASDIAAQKHVTASEAKDLSRAKFLWGPPTTLGWLAVLDQLRATRRTA